MSIPKSPGRGFFFDVEGAKEDIHEMQRLLQHIPKGAQKALTRAVNRTLTATRAEAVRQARGRYVVKAGTVRDALRVHKATYTRPDGYLSAHGRLQSLMRFKVTPNSPKSTQGKRLQSRSRVRLMVTKGKPAILRRAFVARMSTGVGLFQWGNKKTVKDYRTKTEGMTVKKLYSLSIPQMLQHKQVSEKITATAAERMKKELNRQVAYLLEGGK